MFNRSQILKLSLFGSLAVLILVLIPMLNLPTFQIVEMPALAFSNPAAEYCVALGYEYALVDTGNGVYGECQFPDGEACEEWAFLTGDCGADYGYCAQEGLQQAVRTDGGMFTQQVAVCVGADGAEVSRPEVAMGLEELASENCREGETDSVVMEVMPSPTEEQVGVLPSSFDWRSNGGNFMTPVKDQGICGSCWSFGAVGVTESAHEIANNNPGLNLDLSEQYLVSDCLTNNSCCGGWHYNAFNYIKNAGVPNESCMPYVDGLSTGCNCFGGPGCDAKCTYSSSIACSDRKCSDRCATYLSQMKRISSYASVNNTVNDIKTAIYNKGPVAVAISMTGSFSGGKYYCANDSTWPNHVVIISGWTSDGAWIVKNSWGPTWDGDGYFLVPYGECNINNYVYYAVAEGSNIPIVISPSATIKDTTPTYKWRKVPGAANYQIQVLKGRTVVHQKVMSAAVCGTTYCNYTPTTVLSKGVEYQWHVRAYKSSVWWAWSKYLKFAPVNYVFNHGFGSTSMPSGWNRVRGVWESGISGKYLRGKNGLLKLNQMLSTAWTTSKFGKFDYTVRMRRVGEANSANYLYVRGKRFPVNTNYAWYTGYRFQYTNGGKFAVWKDTGANTYAAKKNFTYSSAINQGGWNTLRVTCSGGVLKFYINGTKVWSGVDPDYPTGLVGIGFYKSATGGDQRLMVDWAKLSKFAVSAPAPGDVEDGSGDIVTSDPGFEYIP